MADETITTDYDAPAEGEQEPTDAAMGAAGEE